MKTTTLNTSQLSALNWSRKTPFLLFLPLSAQQKVEFLVNSVQPNAGNKHMSVTRWNKFIIYSVTAQDHHLVSIKPPLFWGLYVRLWRAAQSAVCFPFWQRPFPGYTQACFQHLQELCVWQAAEKRPNPLRLYLVRPSNYQKSESRGRWFDLLPVMVWMNGRMSRRADLGPAQDDDLSVWTGRPG